MCLYFPLYDNAHRTNSEVSKNEESKVSDLDIIIDFHGMSFTSELGVYLPLQDKRYSKYYILMTFLDIPCQMDVKGQVVVSNSCSRKPWFA